MPLLSQSKIKNQKSKFSPLFPLGVLSLLALSAAAHAADPVSLLAPVKAYVKPGEPIAIRFLTSDKPEAQPDLDALGLKAADLPNLFTTAKPEDITGSFQLYTFDGKLIPNSPPLDIKAPTNNPLDLSLLYPQLKSPGTYILTWKSATPLVIENLSNPGRSPKDLAAAQDQLKSLPKETQDQVLKQFLPTVIHIVPLQYALLSTDQGDMKATFWYDVAPHTVDNFISLANQNFYDNTAFHRIIKGFMIQGGDSTGSSEDRAGTGGPGYQIMQEFNDRPHERGTLSMARSQSPDSAGSQFFVVHQKAPHLDHKYTGFGQVFDGLPVIDKITETPTTDENGSVAPKNRPTLKSLRILPATPEIYGLKK